MARTIVFNTRMKEAYHYPGSAWFTGFVGGSYEFLSQPGARNLEARDLFHHYATGVTPAMALKLIGRGSQYAIAMMDSLKKVLHGGKTYKVHLPPNIPAREFWSFVVYDNQTRSMVQTDQQFPGPRAPDRRDEHGFPIATNRGHGDERAIPGAIFPAFVHSLIVKSQVNRQSP